MDYVSHFHREVVAVEAAARQAAAADEAPMVPSCPAWSLSDLVGHLGWVHRYVSLTIDKRLMEQPGPADLGFLGLPADRAGWPTPESPPSRGPVPPSLIDWFAEGAAGLEERFRSTGPDVPVWTWSREQSVGFWMRMQMIEAAVHRWDAENAVGTPRPMAAELAVDAVAQNFQVMAPARRAQKEAPPGSGERFRFRQTDGAGIWTVRFEGAGIRLSDGAQPHDVELAGTASDLMLFLWHRITADQLEVKGSREMLERYFALVPPV